MSFASFSKHTPTNYTVVDNLFISQFMPNAPKGYTEVYLLGLWFCSLPGESNTLDYFERMLSMSQSDILDAFTYWEELGVVHITQKNPLEVAYLDIKSTDVILKRIKPTKYAKFNREIQSIVNNRMITPNEFNEYHVFLETTYFEPEALLLVAKYCVELKGAAISYKYILTVANNLAIGKKLTYDAVEQELSGHPKFNEDVLAVYKVLGVRHDVDYDDRRLVKKWLSEFGFTLAVVLYVAKNCRKGGMGKLDSLLGEYYKNAFLSEREIADYENNKAKAFDLARSVNKVIGVYYQSVDYIVEEYVSKWYSKGFDDDTLLTIARYCFITNIRTLEGVNHTVERFYKLGLLTSASINQYVEQLIKQDELIKELLEAMNVLRYVTSSDRANYKTWTENWGIEHALILHAALSAATASSPIPYLNKILSRYKEQGITKLENISSSPAAVQNPSKALNYEQRSYTKEQLDALFDDISKTDM